MYFSRIKDICFLSRKRFLTSRLHSKRYASIGARTDEHSDAVKKICKILSSSPRVILDAALDQSGVRPTPEIAEDVLKRFENAGMVAHRFFQWAEKQRRFEHSVKAYHIVIEGLAKIRQYEVMWDVVNTMRKKGLLNVETFCVIMRKYARAGKVDEALYTFNVMEKHGVDTNLAAFNGLISAFCKSKNVRKAQEFFDASRDKFTPDPKTYSMLIEGWGKSPNLPKAREVFRDMIDDGCEPDIVTYGIMVDVLCKAGRISEALEIVKEMDERGCRPTSFIYSVLIHTFGQEKRVEDAVETFLEMERNGVRPDVAVYNALIGSFCKVNRFQNVRMVLKEMNSESVTPNSRTYNIILGYLIEQNDRDKAFRVFRQMIKLCDPDSDTYTMMIKMFCQNNDLEMGLKVWRCMKAKQHIPSMHTFQVLVNGFCDAGNAEQACILIEDMIEKGMRPSRTTFKRLRKLLLKEGREDVLKFLLEKTNALVKEPLWD